MLTVRRQGSIESAIAALRSIPERVIPYAAATALTRTAKAAQADIVATMPKVFDSPTRYTLNSTFVQPASVAKPSARVAVKDQASGGTAPEHYLLPEVEGGERNDKRFERALSYAGVLSAGRYAVAGRDAPRDASGNLLRSEIASALKARAAGSGGGKGGKAKSSGAPSYFLAGRLGLFKREGDTVTGILIFVDRAPRYSKRLDFVDVARRAAEEGFADEFAKAAQQIMSRSRA